eukprot:GHVR01081553.1.p1 GENE.GHVR01081553.1~~GHVR01081553.1.p1  ORF type:complete len:220 (+),score=27.18 GHVR01081553.1:564-1223(+)
MSSRMCTANRPVKLGELLDSDISEDCAETTPGTTGPSTTERTGGGLVFSRGDMQLVPFSTDSGARRHKRKADDEYPPDRVTASVTDSTRPPKRRFTHAEDSPVLPQLLLDSTSGQEDAKGRTTLRIRRSSGYSLKHTKLHTVKLDTNITLPLGCLNEFGEIFILPTENNDISILHTDNIVCPFAPPPKWIPMDEYQYDTVRTLTQSHIHVPTYTQQVLA